MGGPGSGPRRTGAWRRATILPAGVRWQDVADRVRRDGWGAVRSVCVEYGLDRATVVSTLAVRHRVTRTILEQSTHSPDTLAGAERHNVNRTEHRRADQ